MHRKILDSDIWHDVTTFRLFIYLIINASHKDGAKVHGIELNEGQYLRSYRKIAEDLAYMNGGGLKEYSISTIKRSVKKLVDSERVSKLETEYGTLFTVLNYSLYQGYRDSGDGTQNATQNEPRTNPERTQNNINNGNNGDNGNKKDNTLRRTNKFDDNQYKLAELLFKKIRENKPNYKEPNLEKWANDIRLMMERDKRTGKEIQDVILWSQQHHFWHSNILSVSKLRKQFDRLQMQMEEDGKLKVIQGGGIKHAETSYKTDYSKYDFSKGGDMRWLRP